MKDLSMDEKKYESTAAPFGSLLHLKKKSKSSRSLAEPVPLRRGDDSSNTNRKS